MTEEKQIFWLGEWKGKAKGGYFIRNDLCNFFKKLKENNIKPVGIAVDEGFNMEIIVEGDLK